MRIILKPLDTLLAEHTYAHAGRMLGLSKQNLTSRLNGKKSQYVDEQRRVWILSHEPPTEEVPAEDTKVQREQRRVENIFKVARACDTYTEFREWHQTQYKQARERGLLPMIKEVFK